MISRVVSTIKELSPGEIAAFCYADIFGVALSRAQAKHWSIATTKKLILPSLHPDPGKNKRFAQEKTLLAQKIAKDLAFLPFIEAIFLTGDVAVEVCAKAADIDLMIITSPNTLWLTRLLVVSRLVNKKMYKRLICPNIFLDTNHLKISEQNLYTAHEVLQAKCLFDRSSVESKWLQLNSWTKNYLPNAYNYKIQKPKSNSKFWILGIGHWLLELVIGFIEIIVFLLQYLYMRPKMTNERVGWGFAFFHPRKLSSHILQEYQKRLKLTQ